MNRIRWGIIGAGRIAHSFAGDIAASSNAELTAVAARSGDNARGFAAQYQIPHAHEGYPALYDNPEVDAVYVATPHSFHLPNCEQAMLAGKAVLCEKPLVLNPNEAIALITTAQLTGRYLIEGMWTWFLPAIRKAQEWVSAGRIGEVRHLKADFGYPLQYSPDLREYDARVGGGCVLEMGIYPIAIARLFLPGQPQDIQVVGRTAANGVEDDVSAVLDYGHAIATLSTSFRCKLQNWAYVIGTQGYIAIPDFWRAEQCSLYSLDERIDHFEEPRDTFGFNYQIEEVSADILAGRKESAVVPLETSLALQRDMLEIRHLARAK